MQTLQELLTKKKLANNTTKAREFLFGKKVRIIGNKGNHYLPVGSTVELSSLPNIYTQYYNGSGSTLYFYDVTLIGEETLGDIADAIALQNKAIKEAEQEIESLEAKKKFMISNKLEAYNEDEYKIYTVLQTLKGKKTDIEKAKVIAGLIKS